MDGWWLRRRETGNGKRVTGKRRADAGAGSGTAMEGQGKNDFFIGASFPLSIGAEVREVRYVTDCLPSFGGFLAPTSRGSRPRSCRTWATRQPRLTTTPALRPRHVRKVRQVRYSSTLAF